MKRIIFALALLVLSCQATSVIETRVTVNAPTQSVSTGYLYWDQSPSTPVFIFGEYHQVIPDEVFTERLIENGTGCMAEPGTLYQLDESVKHPETTSGIVILDGSCEGFRGWIIDSRGMHNTPK